MLLDQLLPQPLQAYSTIDRTVIRSVVSRRTIKFRQSKCSYFVAAGADELLAKCFD